MESKLETAYRRTKILVSHLQNNASIESILSTNECKNEEMDTLELERAKSTFDIQTMNYLLNGGECYVKKRELATLMIERDPILNDGLSKYDLSRAEERESVTRKLIRAVELLKGKDEEFRLAFHHVMGCFDESFGMRMFVHYSLWIGTISNQGTEEQIRKWIIEPNAEEMKIIGCFGMTELGHSSFLRGAETSATFDEQTDEFVIHSPTITATKFWIGLAGQIATHCIVFANLTCKNKDCGIQLFIVPLRDRETGRPYPGVSVGDLGPKAGRNGLDNGWIQFTNVRIPRENMLARWAQVTREGEFIPPPNPALAYGSTITERVGSVRGTTDFADQALTIAVRYAAIRRQGPGNPQILNFQTHQDRLIPHIAQSYATHFTYQRINVVYQDMLKSLRSGNIHGFLKPLPDVHNTSCGLKAFCTWWGTEVLEMCRRSMGGHAYSAFSGIPRLINDYGVMTTGGGDNIVLAQQTARYLLKSFQQAHNGEKLSGSVHYIRHPWKDSLSATKVSELMDTDMHLRAFQFVAISMLERISTKIVQDLSSGQSKQQSWNSNLLDLTELVRFHIYIYMLESFVEKISETSDERLATVLKKLCHLFSLRFMQKQIHQFIETGFISPDQISLINQAVILLCTELRTVAVPLVDSFGIPDLVLNSPLGRYDGNIYHHYLQAVKNSRGGSSVAPYWDSILKPHFQK